MTAQQREFEIAVLTGLRTRLVAIEAIVADIAKLATTPPSVTLSYGALTLTTSDASLISDASTALTNSLNSDLDDLLSAAITARQVATI